MGGLIRPGYGQAFAVAFLFLLVAVAGCAGGSSKAVAAGPNKPAGPATFDDTTGGIEGQIVDDEQFPVAGAQVGIISLQMTTVSDAGGHFSLSKVPPGDYQLAVNALGYEPTAQAVSIVAGQVDDQVMFSLQPIAIKLAYSHPTIQRGLFGCGVSARPGAGLAACGVLGIVSELGGPDTSAYDKFLLEYDVKGGTDAGWTASAFEMKWESNQAMGKALWMIWEVNGCSNVGAMRLNSGAGNSILKLNATSARISSVMEAAKTQKCGGEDVVEWCHAAECRIMSRVFSEPGTLGPSSAADIGVTSQQTFEQTHTAFYNMAEPASYTAYL